MSAYMRMLPGASGRRVPAIPWVGFLDQTLSSLTNFAATFVGLASLTAAGFGAFSIAIAWYVITIGATRALISEPQAIRYAGSPPLQWRTISSRCAGSAMVLGMAAGAGVSVGALLFGGRVASPLLVLAVCLPLLALQDSYRLSFIISRRYGHALANDGVWALCLVPVLAILMSIGSFEPSVLVAAWAGTGAFAGLVGIGQSRAIPHLGALRGWLRSEGSLAYRFVAEFGLQRGSYELALILILAVSDLAVVGAIAGARFLFAPLTVVFLSAQLVGIPEMVRLRGRSRAMFRRASVILVVFLAALGLGAGAFIWLMRGLVAPVIGPSWADIASLLLPMSVLVAASGTVLGATIVLRALAAARTSLRASLVGAVALVVVAPISAISGSALAATWGLAIGGLIGAIYWVISTRNEIRRSAPYADAPTRGRPEGSH